MLKPEMEKLLQSLSITELERLLKAKEKKSTGQHPSKKVKVERQVIHHRHCMFCGSDEVKHYKMTDISYLGIGGEGGDITMDVDVTSCGKCYETLSQLPTIDVIVRALNVIGMMQKEWRGQKMPKRREKT